MDFNSLTSKVKGILFNASKNAKAWKEVLTTPRLRQQYAQEVVKPNVTKSLKNIGQFVVNQQKPQIDRSNLPRIGRVAGYSGEKAFPTLKYLPPEQAMKVSHFAAGLTPLPAEKIALGQRLPDREKYQGYRTAGAITGGLATAGPAGIGRAAAFGAGLGGVSQLASNIYNKQPLTTDLGKSMVSSGRYGAETAQTLALTGAIVEDLAKTVNFARPFTEKSISKTLPQATQTIGVWLKNLGKTGLKRIFKAALIETPVEAFVYGVKEQREGQPLADSIGEQAVENFIFNIGFAGMNTAWDARTITPIVKRSLDQAIQSYKAMPPEIRQGGYARLPGKEAPRATQPKGVGELPQTKRTPLPYSTLPSQAQKGVEISQKPVSPIKIGGQTEANIKIGSLPEVRAESKLGRQLLSKKIGLEKPQEGIRVSEPKVKESSEEIIAQAKKQIGKPSEPKEGVRETLSDLYTDWVNRFQPIEDVPAKIEKETGTNIIPALSPKYTVKQLLGAGGTAGWRHKKELMPVLKELDNIGIKTDEMDVFLKAKRDVGFGEVGREIIGSSPLAARKVIDALGQKYDLGQLEATAQKLYGYQDQGLKKLLEAGFINQEGYDAIKKSNKYYVPFERVMDTVDNYLGIPTAKAQQATQPIKRIKGSERQIVSPIESIIANTYKIEAAVAKNRVAKSLVDLQKIPGYEGMFPRTKKTGDTIISVWEDGKKNYYNVGSKIARAVKGLNEESMGTLTKILSAPASLLRQGATGRNIDFMVPNVVKDQFDAAISSQYGYRLFIDYFRGLAHLLNYKFTGSDEMVEEYLKEGGSIYFESLSGRKAIKEQIGEATIKPGILKRLKDWAIGGIETFGELSETPTRIGLFQRALEKTSNPLIAAYEAREGTLDFARMGAKMKTANSLIPFLNVGVQGFDKLVRNVKARPGQMVLNVAIYGGLPAAMASLYNNLWHPEELETIEEWVKDSNFVIITGSSEDGKAKYISIPKGNIVPYIANPTEHLVSWMFKNDPRGAAEMALYLFSEGLPVLAGGYNLSEVGLKTIGSNIPQAFKPVMENLLNKSFFKTTEEGKPQDIVPYYLAGKEPYQQTFKFTPEVYKVIGKVTNISPLKIKNILEGYLAGYIKMPVNVTEVLNSISKGEKVDVNEIPVLRRFFGQSYNTTQDVQKIKIKSGRSGESPISAKAAGITISLPKETEDLKTLYKDAKSTVEKYRENKIKTQYGLVEKDLEEYQAEFDKANEMLRQIERERPEQVFEIQLDTYKSGGGKKVEERGDWAAEQIQKAIQGAYTGDKIVITQGFGNYNPAIERYSGGINIGTDLRAGQGTPVTIPGGNWKVVEVSGGGAGTGANRGYGNSVVIQNDKGESLRFSHLSGISAQQGQVLKQGDLVGLTGATGNVTGPHLDVEYRKDGRLGDVTKTKYGASYLATTALSQDIINKMWETGVLTTGKAGTAEYLKNQYGIDVYSYTGSDSELKKAIEKAKALNVTVRRVSIPKVSMPKLSPVKFKGKALPKIKIPKPPKKSEYKPIKIAMPAYKAPDIKISEIKGLTNAVKLL